jgi:nickel/cobalt transporter (NicO) family protein
MNSEIIVLAVTAASIGFFHTLFGPDHYVPFIVVAKARQWTKRRTLAVTLLCGLGHVGSSVLLGMLGIACGTVLDRLISFESIRGDWAAWALISFGLVYFVYGLRRAFAAKDHGHSHTAHFHDRHRGSFHWTPWALFVIFVLGPCEPLIPILMYPALQHSLLGTVVVTAIFSFTTIATMMVTVMLATYSFDLLPLKRFERFSHALAGSAIMLCGCAIIFLGL